MGLRFAAFVVISCLWFLGLFGMISGWWAVVNVLLSRACARFGRLIVLRCVCWDGCGFIVWMVTCSLGFDLLTLFFLFKFITLFYVVVGLLMLGCVLSIAFCLVMLFYFTLYVVDGYYFVY